MKFPATFSARAGFVCPDRRPQARDWMARYPSVSSLGQNGREVAGLSGYNASGQIGNIGFGNGVTWKAALQAPRRGADALVLHRRGDISQ